MKKKSRISVRTVLAITLALLLYAGVAAAEAPGQLKTVQSGTVSGDLFFKAYQPVPWYSQASPGTVTSRDFSQAFALPSGASGANIAWARLYVSVYSGSGSADWPLKTSVMFDGNGDGSFETTLGTEMMQGIGYSTDGTVHTLNNHCNRVYSDYLAWYDVKSRISSSNPSVKVRTEQIGTASYDGRLKAIALVVAYNDGDADQVHYWVNDGHAWIDSGSTATGFGTAGVPSGVTSATLSSLALSSVDGAYSFNGHSLAGANPSRPLGFFCSHAWDIKSYVTAGAGSTLTAGLGNGGASFKSVLAALAVRSSGSSPTTVPTTTGTGTVTTSTTGTTTPDPSGAPVASFSANTTTGAVPLTVQFTDSSTGGVTSWAWDLNNDGTIDSTNQNPSAIYSVAGTFTVSLTVTGPGGSDTEVKTGYITAGSTTLNGYRGKRYTGGSDMTTQAMFEGRVNLAYSTGNSAYSAAFWPATTVSWSATDLPVPAGATVTSARLYQGYTWNYKTSDPAWTMTFNGATVTPAATYRDRKGWGTYDLPQGLYVYDVTGLFNAAGNTLTITPEADNNYGIYGAYIVVVYSDATTTEKKIWINDECDILASGTSLSATSEEATAYAPFAGVDTTGMSGARAIAILSNANEDGKSKFFFNSNEYTGFWSAYLTGPQVGFSSYDVTAALTPGNNTARLQSYDPGTKGDNMYAQNVILIVEKGGVAPTTTSTTGTTTVPTTGPTSIQPTSTTGVPTTATPKGASFTAAPVSAPRGAAVKFTLTPASGKTIRSAWWSFDAPDHLLTWNSRNINPTFFYPKAGSFSPSVKLTYTDGTTEEVRQADFIIVAGTSLTPPSGASASFDATPLSNSTSSGVRFTLTQTAGKTIQSVWWSFDAPDHLRTWNSRAINPTFFYPAKGTFSPYLLITYTDGSTEEVHRVGYIVVA
jgi:PKD repeat protein